MEPPAGARPVGRDDVTQIVRRELFLEIFRRKFFSCLGYLFVVAIILGIPAFFIGSFVAKTGFVEIPLLTDWLYEPAQPMRTVATSGTTRDVIMLNVGSRSKYDPGSGLLNTSIKEGELTAFAIASLRAAPSDKLPFAISGLQVAIDPDVIEIFAVSPRGSRDATVLIRLTPQIVGQSLHLNLKELRLGSAQVPRSIAQSLVSVISTFVADDISKGFAEVGVLTSVEAEAGLLRVTLIPKTR